MMMMMMMIMMMMTSVHGLVFQCISKIIDMSKCLINAIQSPLRRTAVKRSALSSIEILIVSIIGYLNQ